MPDEKKETYGGVSNHDLDHVFKCIMSKRNEYGLLFDYYDGLHPETYLTQRLRDLFKGIDVHFSENWCAVVVDAMLARIDIAGIAVVTKGQAEASETERSAVQIASDELWMALQMAAEADDLHEALLVTGEGVIIVGEEQEADLETDNSTRIESYFNDPRMVHVCYDSRNPHLIAYAGKMWKDDDGHFRLTMYYPDRFEYYRSRHKAEYMESQSSDARSFDLFSDDGSDPVQPNPYAPKIPVFHFRSNRRKNKSELENIIPIQNVINKLLNDEMAAAEFAAYRQKYIISGSLMEEGSLENSPGALWNIPAGDGMGQQTSVGEFSETSLSNYIQAIEREVAAISAISQTPKHYFVDAGAGISGEALIAMEAPLNKKCAKRISQYARTWQDLWSFVLRLAGHEVKATDITALYAKPETVQPLTQAQIRQTNRDSGIPLSTALRWEGRDKKEIDQILQEKVEQAAEEQKALGESLLSLNAGKQQNNPVNKREK